MPTKPNKLRELNRQVKRGLAEIKDKNEFEAANL
jgi:hypothetical protein